METDRQKIEVLAESLVEGDAIDWQEASSADDPESTRSAIRSLQVVQKLRGFALDSVTRVPDIAREHPASDALTTEILEPAHGRWGHLQLREILGRGAQGTVYRAWDPNLETDVALKLDCDRLIARDEARRLARIDNEHVVRVHGVAEHNGRFGLWMEYVRGRSLAERIAADGLMSESEAIDLGDKLASALAAIHAVNVVHQDVKAHNVMREERGRYVLMDLGCGADLNKGQTDVGGTPYYMAPELMSGARPDKRADIYSLGVLLYHVVTGRFPYEGQTLSEIQERQQIGSPARLHDLRPALSTRFCQVVEKALDADPNQRFASAGAMKEELESLGGTNGPAIPSILTRLYRRAAAGFVSLPRGARVALSGAIAATLAVTIAVGIQTIFFPPERLDLELELYRAGETTSEVLQSGSRIGAGDKLMLQLRGSLPCHVYIFGADEEGGLVRLFPLSYSDQQNPLEARIFYQLPGKRKGKALTWGMSSTQGRDRLLVVASPEQFRELEEFMDEIGEMGAPGSEQSRDLGSLRGFDRTVEVADSLTRVRQVEDDYRELKKIAEELEGAWIQEYQLLNAGG